MREKEKSSMSSNILTKTATQIINEGGYVSLRVDHLYRRSQDLIKTRIKLKNLNEEEMMLNILADMN